MASVSFICVCDHCDAAIASLYCHADGVFLCASCDQAVHSNKIAQKHIRVPHTACPVHAYDEAKSKGRARDLPLVALQHPAAAATPRSVRPGQLPSHQTSGQAQGSFGSETGLASGVSPLPRASPVSEKGQQQQQRQLPEASQDHVSSANLLDSSDASYQLGTYDSLDKSVRGGRALVSMLADFGVASASSLDGRLLHQQHPLGAAASGSGLPGDTSTCTGFDMSQSTSMHFGSLKSSMTQTLLQQSGDCMKGSAMAQEGARASMQLLSGAPAAPIPINSNAAVMNHTAESYGAGPFMGQCIMSDPGRAGSFLASSVDYEGSVHAGGAGGGGVSSTTTPGACLVRANTASTIPHAVNPMDGSSQACQCGGVDVGGSGMRTSFSPHASTTTTTTVAAVAIPSCSTQRGALASSNPGIHTNTAFFPGSSAPVGGMLSSAAAAGASGQTLASPGSQLPTALNSLSSGTRSFDSRHPFNIEPAPPSVIEAKARALINSSSRTQQPVLAYDLSQLVTRIERPDGTIREIDIERAAQLHRYRQKRVARMKAYAEGQRKVRHHEDRKAAADTRPRNKGRFTKVGSTDKLGDLMHSSCTSGGGNTSIHGLGAAGAALGIGSVDSGMVSAGHHISMGCQAGSGSYMGGVNPCGGQAQSPGMLGYSAAVAAAAAEQALGLRRAMSCNSVPFPQSTPAPLCTWGAGAQQGPYTGGSLDMHVGSSSALPHHHEVQAQPGRWDPHYQGAAGSSGRAAHTQLQEGAQQLPTELSAALGAALNEASLTITDQELAALGVECDGMMAMMARHHHHSHQQQQVPKSPQARSEQSGDSTHDSTRGGNHLAPFHSLTRLTPGDTHHHMTGNPTHHHHPPTTTYTAAAAAVHRPGHIHSQQGMAMNHDAQCSCPQGMGMSQGHMRPAGELHHQHTVPAGSSRGHQQGVWPGPGMRDAPDHHQQQQQQQLVVPGDQPMQDDNMHVFGDDDVFGDQHVSGLLEALLDEQSPDIIMPFGFP